MVWAANASSITCLALPTTCNLAGASPGVNHFSWMECRGSVTRIGYEGNPAKKVQIFENQVSQTFLLPAIDIGDANVRDSSNRLATDTWAPCPSRPQYHPTCFKEHL
jgi:hypothetical protein